MSRNDEYWARREAVEKQWMADNLKNDEAYAKHINGYYDKMLTNIQDRINDQYTKYAGKQGLTMAEAKGAVSTADQVAYAKEAKDAVAEAQKLFKQNGSVSYADFSQELNDHMKLYNATMRINRLEYLKAQIGLEATKAGVKVGVDMSNKATEDYLAEVKRQAALLGNYLPPSELTNYKQAFEQVMRSGNPGSFSQILWKNTDAMKAQLDMGLSQMLVQGLSPLTIARELRKHLQDTVQSAKYVSERLARTESARAQTLAQRDCYTDLGVKQVRWIAEPSACKTCTAIATERDGIYGLDDVPAIPVHANCRCSMAPHTGRDEMNKLIEAANTENLKTNQTPEENNLHFEKRGMFVRMMKNLGFNKVSSSGLNLDVMEKVYGTIENFYHEYPQMRGYIKQLTIIHEKYTGKVAGASFNKTEWKKGHIVPELKLNVEELSDFNKTLASQVELGSWTLKSDYSGVINHELAHMIHHKLALTRGGYIEGDYVDLDDSTLRPGFIKTVKMLNTHEIDKKTMLAAFNNANIEYTRTNVRKYISQYGTTNDAEAFAEAMSNEDTGNIITKETQKIAREELKEIAIGPTRRFNAK